MWLLFACLSAVFAGMTSVLSKIGIENTDSNSGTAIRTTIVFLFSRLMVFAIGAQKSIENITVKALIFLVLSGLATGESCMPNHKGK